MISPRVPAWMMIDLSFSAAMAGLGVSAAVPSPMMPSNATPAAAIERIGDGLSPHDDDGWLVLDEALFQACETICIRDVMIPPPAVCC